MLFNELILEAERSGYLLGSHSAREGEKVRGMPRQSTIADIGFYNRDPEEDVKHPSTPTPAADLKPRLPELIFQSILVNLNRFFNAQEGSEGALMNVLLNTAPKAILHGES